MHLIAAGQRRDAQCSNGREAIQAFRTHRPDVTLMDLQMPEMSGMDAIGAIRGELPEARIIVLTTGVWRHTAEKWDRPRPESDLRSPLGRPGDDQTDLDDEM